MQEKKITSSFRMKARNEALRRAIAGCGIEALETRQLLAGDISGHVFNDLDSNGSQDGGEGNLQNFRVYIDANANEEYDIGESNVFTNASGNYAFEGIPNGTYDVRLSPPDDWVTTSPVGGGYSVTVNDDVTNNQDFGTRALVGKVQGIVYNDANGNGSQDVGENGLQNFRVYVDANDNGEFDGGEFFIFTPANGEWEIGDLPPDTYKIRVDPGSQYAQTQPADAYEVTLVGDDTIASNDFGVQYIVGAVRGTVFIDTNSNGELDPGEDPAENFQVYVDIDNSGTLTQGDVVNYTNAQGQWQFEDLAPGNYAIRIEQGDAWAVTTPAGSVFNTTVVANQDVNLGGFGVTEVIDDDVTIAGTVFIDVNENGVFDQGTDTVAVGWTVFRDLNGNGERDGGEPSVTTGQDGSWSFTHLPAGTHIIDVVVQNGYVLTAPVAGNFSVNLPANQSSTGNRFGVKTNPVGTATISGRVFNDANGDGSINNGETGRAGATLYLDTNNNGVRDNGETTATSDNNGNYSFTDLAAGTYNVRVVGIQGLSLTVPSNGVYNRNVVDGTNSTGNHFGFMNAPVTGFVRNDFNGDGKADLIFRDSATGVNTVWYMNGVNRVGIATLPALGSAWSLGATGDFNGDDKTDIVWHNNGTGETVIWLMNGITRTSSVAVPSVNAVYRLNGAGDFDNDGNTDLVFRSSTTGVASVWFMNGTALRQNNSFGALPQVVSQNWQIADIQDYDGDSDPDILWTNSTTKQNSLWRMNGRAVQNDGFRGIRYPTAEGWRLAAVSHFDLDSTPDLLWAKGNSNSVWLLDDVDERPVDVDFTQLASGLVVP